ncbi:MAG: hypothetical protein MJ175_05345 [Clostridia bacterium]|nr:hypothetical protein [Clostridia bacterium]
MKKQLSLTLAAATLLLAFASCGDETKTPTETQTPNGGNATEALTEAVDPRPELGLPDMDFGGAEYRISCYAESDAESLYADSLNGEGVNDAIYKRNSMMMEKYNFKLTLDNSVTEYNEHGNMVSRFVLAGDDAFELIYGHVVGTCNNAIAGYFMNLYEVPNLDLSKPWWPKQYVDEMTVYGKMFTICSGINYNQLASAKVLVFNKDILSANDMVFPYDMVRSGKWTMDELISQTKDLYQDVNGNGTHDIEDIYGFMTYPSQNGFLVSTKTSVLAPTADGGREFSVMSDKTVSLVEKIYDWYYGTNGVLLSSYQKDDPDYLPPLFANGHAAYAFSHLYFANQFYREADISYGVAPMPKYDEQQDGYYVFACPSLFSIPITTQNPEFAGYIFEAMTYYGYYDIIPAYYEITLKGKIADSPDDVEMLGIINDNLTVSFAYCYDNWEGFAHLLGSRMNFTKTGGSKDVASMYQKNLKPAQRRLDKVLAGFAD